MTLYRHRIAYAFLIILTIGLGLFSRSRFIPEMIYPYLGDAFYALLFFFMIGIAFPGLKSRTVALASVGFCYSIELSQLYQSDWMLALRATRLGALILGHHFLWSDLVSYAVGGSFGLLLESLQPFQKKWMQAPQNSF